MRAIISADNREGLAALGQALQARNVAIFSTSGTAQALREAGVAVEPVSALTDFPEILGGRVKTLHPAVFGGILARRDHERDLLELQEHHLELIDIVVVNLYPFIETVARQDTTLAEALEQIDIGGVALIRAAAKNFEHVLVLVRPQDYAPVMQEWQDSGQVSFDTRRRLAATAFQYIAGYDSAIAGYLRAQSAEPEVFPADLTLSLRRIQTLRYGENPHQQAALYGWREASHSTEKATITGAEILHGKELSFNNLLDLDAALAAASSFSAPTVVIVKHTNPCGLACDDTLVEAYKKAHAGDPISAFGGIIGCNRPLDAETSREINQLFYEAIIAPAYTPEALAILRQKKNLRLLATRAQFVSNTTPGQRSQHLDVRSLSGGLLLQTPDTLGEQDVSYRAVTEREPTLEEVTDLMFAWKVVKRVKSNAIVLAHKLAVVGVGAGQMNRVASVQLALEKAATRARGSVLASDAYFPFPDSVEAAAKAGVTAIIQPGGSIRDEESIRMANRYAIAMIFTGQRHFRH